MSISICGYFLIWTTLNTKKDFSTALRPYYRSKERQKAKQSLFFRMAKRQQTRKNVLENFTRNMFLKEIDITFGWLLCCTWCLMKYCRFMILSEVSLSCSRNQIQSGYLKNSTNLHCCNREIIEYWEASKWGEGNLISSCTDPTDPNFWSIKIIILI